jgi:tetratricopeptide (TPR) repeat protein
MSGQLPEALSDLDDLIRGNSKDADLRFQRGLVHANRLDYQPAIDDLKEAVKLTRDNPNADLLAELGWLLVCAPDRNNDDMQEALRVTKDACEMSKSPKPRHLDSRAAALAHSGDFEQARKLEQQAIDLSTNEAEKNRFRDRLKLYDQEELYRLPARQ